MLVRFKEEELRQCDQELFSEPVTVVLKISQFRELKSGDIISILDF